MPDKYSVSMGWSVLFHLEVLRWRLIQICKKVILIIIMMMINQALCKSSWITLWESKKAPSLHVTLIVEFAQWGFFFLPQELHLQCTIFAWLPPIVWQFICTSNHIIDFSSSSSSTWLFPCGVATANHVPPSIEPYTLYPHLSHQLSGWLHLTRVYFWHHSLFVSYRTLQRPPGRAFLRRLSNSNYGWSDWTAERIVHYWPKPSEVNSKSVKSAFPSRESYPQANSDSLGNAIRDAHGQEVIQYVTRVAAL